MSDLILVLLVVVPTVALSIWWAMIPPQTSAVQTPEDLPEILVKDGIVEHASDAALDLLPITIGAHSWQDLHDIFEENYPDFPPQPHPAQSAQTVLQGGCDQAHQIEITWHKHSISLVLKKAAILTALPADVPELEALREIIALSPHPVWKTDASGAVIWKNCAYGLLAERLRSGASPVPASIFDIPSTAAQNGSSRVKIVCAQADGPEWFDVVHTKVAQGTIHQATSLSALIKAEDAQRDFVQTLAKTFAHLSIGLAIFNRDRQLALFNPALIDLTGLSVSFLSPRPTIDSFFDAMRENRRMPEPKNYKTWRQRMADLVSAAELGRFEETWTLESGQTYNLKGRPQPDGAIAFLIEDVSAEVSLTRNFRAELELGQSLVDTFEDALAVFSQSGILTFSNKAYDALWGFQFDTSFADVTIVDAIRMWKEKSAPNPMWQDLQDSVLTLTNREEWDMPVSIKGQFPMQCKIVPIASGATVIRFARQAVPRPVNLPMMEKGKT